MEGGGGKHQRETGDNGRGEKSERRERRVVLYRKGQQSPAESVVRKRNHARSRGGYLSDQTRPIDFTGPRWQISPRTAQRITPWPGDDKRYRSRSLLLNGKKTQAKKAVGIRFRHLGSGTSGGNGAKHTKDRCLSGTEHGPSKGLSPWPKARFGHPAGPPEERPFSKCVRVRSGNLPNLLQLISSPRPNPHKGSSESVVVPFVVRLS